MVLFFLLNNKRNKRVLILSSGGLARLKKGRRGKEVDESFYSNCLASGTNSSTVNFVSVAAVRCFVRTDCEHSYGALLLVFHYAEYQDCRLMTYLEI